MTQVQNQNEEKPQGWLILTMVVQQVDTGLGKQHIATKLVSWDFATKTQMETYWKERLGVGLHYLIPLENHIVIENIIKPEAVTSPIVKLN